MLLRTAVAVVSTAAPISRMFIIDTFRKIE